MSTSQIEKETTFKEPGLLRVHNIHLRLYENEFEIEDRKGSCRFRFDQFEAMSTATVSNYFNGVPQGIAHSLRLWPKATANSGPVEFLLQQFPEKVDRPRVLGVTVPFSATHANPGNDPVFEELVARLVYQLSLQMIENVETHGFTLWVPQVKLTDRGIQFSPKNQPELSCRFDEIVASHMADGQLLIAAPNSSLTDLQIGTGAINFYPGLKVFEVLRSLR